VELNKYYGLYKSSLNTLNKIDKQLSQYKEMKNFGFVKNDHYLNSLRILDPFSGLKSGLMLFAIGIAVFLVFNLFSITVTERIRQYGLLRSIGVSRKQLNLIVIIEAVLLSILSIPIGITIGCILTKLLIKIISPILEVPLYSVFNFSMMIIISISIIFVASITSLIPSRKAAQLTPIEAIRHTGAGDDLKTRGSMVGRFVNRLMDITKVLAICNINRNKLRAFFTVATLTLSGFVFLVINYFYIYSSSPQQEGNTISSDFELHVNIENSERYTSTELNQIEQISGVKEVYGYNTVAGYLMIFPDKNFVKDCQMAGVNFGFMAGDSICIGAGLLGCNETLLNKLRLKEETLQKIKKNDKYYPGVFSTRLGRNEALPLYKLLSEDTEIYITPSLTIDLNIIRHSSPRVHAYATAYINDTIPFGHGVSAFYMTNSSFEKLTGISGYSDIYININEGSDRKKISEYLQMLTNSKSTGRLEDAEKSLGIIRTFFYQFSVLILGLSFLILLIGIVIMFITIKSNIILRINELGVLRALGMSKTGLKTLFLYEGGYYGVLSSIISLVASIGFCCIIFSDQYSVNPFLSAFTIIPWPIFLGFFFGNIVLSLCITLISIRSLLDMSAVEAIRLN
jgi:putative ABC transport system permease protein